MKKKVILCPNPYRASELKVAKDAKAILEGIGFETVVCLPFHRDGYGDELGVPVRQLQQEIKSADLMIAFGGDGAVSAAGDHGVGNAGGVDLNGLRGVVVARDDVVDAVGGTVRIDNTDHGSLLAS